MPEDLSFDFDADYTVERLSESDSRSIQIRFGPPTPSTGTTVDSHADRSGSPRWVTLTDPSRTIRVTPTKGKQWEGEFMSGAGELNGIYSTPARETLCVVVRGQGYFVDVLAPDNFQLVPAAPIVDVVDVPQLGMILFADYTKIVAYGSAGKLWRTTQLSWDGIDIGSIVGSALHGKAWDSPAATKVPFVLDLKTGAFTGGSSREMYRAGNS